MALKNIALVKLSSIAAQLISFYSTIFIVNNFSQGDYAKYVIYASALQWIAPIIMLKYEQSMLVSRDSEETDVIILLCVIIGVIVTLILPLVYFIAKCLELQFVKSINIEMLYAVMLGGLVTIPNTLALLKYQINENFKKYSMVNSLLPILILACMYATSSVSNNEFSLVISNILAYCIVFAYISMANYEKIKKCIAKFKVTTAKKVLFKYKELPILTMPGTILDSTAQILPAIIFTAKYPIEILAIYTIFLKITAIPLKTVYQSVVTVLQPIVAKRNMDKYEFMNEFNILSLLILICTVTAAILGNYLAESVLNYIFSGKYLDSIELVKNYSGHISLVVGISALSVFLITYGKVIYGILWQVLYLISTLAISLYIYYGEYSWRSAITFYVYKDVVLYSIYYILIARASVIGKGWV